MGVFVVDRNLSGAHAPKAASRSSSERLAALREARQVKLADLGKAQSAAQMTANKWPDKAFGFVCAFSLSHLTHFGY